ncbi:MAG TPA: TIGR02996 domain-containing protein, partial [Kofleriaceae bacterium]|nr:TIGR02996 domain-containing protein [Kofleriaceae bacterium]
MEAELLRAIRERPDDDEPRLVYADFLSERGDPRGELIVLQCKLARLDRDDDERRWMDVRMRALLDAHRATWRAGLDDIPTLGLGYLERGFVRRVALYEEPFVAHAESLLAAAPMLEAVYLRGTEWATPPRVPPELVQLREVQLGSTAFALAALASPYVENIECLQFASECDGPRIVEALARVRLPRLRSLDLGGTRAGRHGVAALLAWPGLAQLTHLDLSNCELDDVGELVGSPNIGKLELLSLAANPLGRRGALAVLTSPQLAALEELRLDQTNAGDAVAYATLPALATLRYSGNPLDADDAVALADARTLTALERLELGGANTHAPTVNAAAAAAILATQNLPALVAIDLGQNHFGPAASATMLRDMRAGLRSLGLAYTSLDQRGVGALASNPSAATLERLDISNNPLDSDAVELLARSPYLR